MEDVGSMRTLPFFFFAIFVTSQDGCVLFGADLDGGFSRARYL